MSNLVYETFFSPGEVTEIRALGGISGKKAAWSGAAFGQTPTISGYFDNPDDFEKAASALNKAGPHGIYFTVQPVLSAFLSRAVNRLQANLKPTTGDDNIKCLRWLLIDLDPLIDAGGGKWVKRPGISSTDEELKNASELAKKIAAWLEDEIGLARAIRACSGNGYHLNYRVPDLPNDEENRELVRQCLDAIANKFDVPAVDVDRVVYNPARIWKLYGTTARKGDTTDTRPHRASYLFPDQPVKLAEVPVCSMEALGKLRDLALQSVSPASPSPSKSKPGPKKKRGVSSQLGPLDVGAYLSHYGRAYKTKQRGTTTLYCLDKCVFDETHGPYEASVCQSPDAPFLTYQCFHDRCHGQTWKDAKAVISGDASLAQFCEGYDPHWTPYDDPGTGILRDMRIAPPSSPKKTEPETSMLVPVSPVPLPDLIDPGEFYEKRGKRLVFVPSLMAKYYLALLDPIVCTNDVFWKYGAGVWKRYPESSLGEICVKALKDMIQASWIDNTIKIFARLVNREEEDWPAQGTYINCLSGMVDVEAGKLLPHDFKYGSRMQIPCNFSVEAYDGIKRWFTFLDEVLPGSQARQSVLQEFYGYCFLGDCRFQKALFLIGGGSNGKSKALYGLEQVLGPENISTLSFMELGQRFKIQFIEGKLANISTETEAKDPMGTDIFKAMVSGDRITGEAKYGKPYGFSPTAKCLVAMNDPPKITDKSYGLGRRIIVLHFPRRFKENEMDPDLDAKIKADRDGIFYWAILGLSRLCRRGRFEIPKEVEADKYDLVSTMNPLLIFIDERCDFGGTGGAVKPKELYQDYKEWCKDGNNRPLSRNNFYHQVLSTFPQVEKKQWGPKKQKHFVGIELRWTAGADGD